MLLSHYGTPSEGLPGLNFLIQKMGDETHRKWAGAAPCWVTKSQAQRRGSAAEGLGPERQKGRGWSHPAADRILLQPGPP